MHNIQALHTGHLSLTLHPAQREQAELSGVSVPSLTRCLTLTVLVVRILTSTTQPGRTRRRRTTGLTITDTAETVLLMLGL